MVTLYVGNDPYRIILEKKKLLAAGYTAVDGITESVLIAAQQSFPLFGEPNYIILCDKVDELEKKSVEVLNRSRFSFAIFPKKTGNGAVSKYLEKEAVTETRNRFTPGELANYVAAQAKEKSVNVTKAGWLALMRRTAYAEDETCDLGRIQTELDKLYALGEVTEPLVDEIVAENPQAKTFSLADAVVGMCTDAAMREADNMTRCSDFKPLMTLGFLEKRYRVAYLSGMLSGMPDSEKAKIIGVSPRFIRTIPEARVIMALRIIGKAKKELKSGGDDALVFTRCIYELSTIGKDREEVAG